jgi:hypothetical protein
MNRRRMIPMVVLVACAVTATVIPIGAAHADPGVCLQDDWVDGDLICVLWADDGRGGQDGTTTPGGSTGSTTTSRYRWQLLAGGEINDAACGPDPAPDPNDPDTPNMTSFMFMRIDLTTGIGEVVEICRSDSQPLAQAPIPPVPNLTSVLGAAETPVPVVTLNPAVQGLTGLETWLWYDGPAELTVAVSLNGYTITGTAVPTSFAWTMGAPDVNGTSTHSADVPGNVDDPAARHTYETVGTYTITLTVTWTGSFTVTGNGLPGGPVDLGTTTVDGTLTYPVREARSILVNGT